MKRCLVAVMLCTSLLGFGADARSQAEVLGRWVGGTWVGSGKFVETAYSQARTVSGATTCAWSPDHIFVVCDQDVMDGTAKMRLLSIYGFDPKKKTFHFYGLSLEGDAPRSGTLLVNSAGNRFEYFSDAEINGKKVQFMTTNEFKTDDEVEWSSSFSTDEGQHWTKMGGGSEQRKK